MLPYYLLFLFFGILAFFEYWKFSKKWTNLFFPISFLILLFFYGLRFDVGVDWSVYYHFYDRVESFGVVLQGEQSAPSFFSPEFAPLDFGYKILNAIFKSLGFGFQGIVFAISLFNLASLYRFISYYKLKYKFTFLLIFLSLAMFREFDVFRQSLSFYIFLLSLKFVDDKVWKYVLINLMGAFLHLGALIFIVMVPVLKMKFSRNQMLVILFFYILTMFVPLPLISATLAVAQMVSLPPWLLVRMVAMHEYLNFPRELGLTISVPCILLLVIMIAKYKKYENLPRRDVVLLNLFFCYLLINIFGSEINEFVTRFGYYFFIGIALAFSFVPILFERTYRLVFAVIPIMFALAKLFLMMETPAAKVTYAPYTNYLFENGKDRFANVDNKRSIITQYYFDR